MTKGQKVRRLLLTVFLLGTAGAVGGLGWQWRSSLRCQRIEWAGTRHADPDTLAALARVDTTMRLYSIDPDLVADRVRRHPWVAAARAVRLPTGTLSIQVEERRPVVLVMDAQGVPSHYLDREGYGLPLAAGAAYDLPILRGHSEPYHPVRRTTDTNVRDLLVALASASREEDALLSDLTVRSSGEVWLHTSPADERGSLTVRLGRGRYAEKLDVLHAFWHQAVLPQPEKTFSLIDLRFDSQVVTREE